MIHPTAIIAADAQIDPSASVGAYSMIGGNVKISKNATIMSHVCIDGYTSIDEGTSIFPFASIGYPPQDLKFNGEKSTLIIGKNNKIREYVTIHPGTLDGNMTTTVGNDNLFMIGVHIAHDCKIGNNVIMGNNATLGGHVEVADNVIIGGLTAIHQWAKIGCGAIIGGMLGVERDIIPYASVTGDRAYLSGLNLTGLNRSNADKSKIQELKKAYEILFSPNEIMENNIKYIENNFSNNKYIDDMLKFLRRKTYRSFCKPK